MSDPVNIPEIKALANKDNVITTGQAKQADPEEGTAVAVAIQGYEGSFHQVAAQHFFGKKTGVICCATFGDVVKKALNKKESDGGVMAIENSIAGSILPNYNLLQKSKLKVVGEIYLQIRQNLLVNPGIALEDIKEVHSHPMAIQQCLEYLDQYNWKLVETEDTALSAKHIHQHKSKHIAAIASTLAADLYNLNVLAPDIHTLTNNYTRFLILQHEDLAEVIENANKASVSFHTDHSRGSLAKVLTTIAEGQINLSKLQSSPIPGSDFRYSFHADMEFDSLHQFYQVIKDMKALTEDVKIYGVYRKGKHYT
ncbi:prephenate dehydratase [Agriterribacter sp.]|uniref:prephenate dehydratase n=1 Tax=Agriterribacter sp. TaxID=2821509 RepID=UPI002CDA2426|nr:prephenate dehydratase [Agriterribacter sp.]HRO47614.1 prephenate dehydratase [Agriterribacter sp.]HRQ17182.1 prephenate dehydratase [Agriterribacter sp.]